MQKAATEVNLKALAYKILDFNHRFNIFLLPSRQNDANWSM